MNTTVNQTPPGVTAPNSGVADSSDNNDYLRAARNYSLLGQAITTMEDVMLLFTELSNAKFAQMSKKMEVSRDAAEKANQVEGLLAGITDPKGKAELPPDVIEYMRENGILVGNQTIDDFLAGKNPDHSKIIDLMKTLIDVHPGRKEISTVMIAAIVKHMEAKGITVDGENITDCLNGKTTVSKDLADKILNALQTATVACPLDKADLTAVKSALETFGGRASDFVQQSQLKMQQLIQNFNTAVTMANSLQSMNAESTKSIAQAIR